MKSDILSTRYTGSTAEQYDSRRTWSQKWKREQDAVEAALSRFPAGSLVLDVPVGTGRFVHLYAGQRLVATGVDMSRDMLSECDHKAREQGYSMRLARGSALALGIKSDSHDVAVCIRFLNWIDYHQLNQVVGELTRVSRGYLIVGVRHLVPLRRLTPWRLIGRLVMRLRRRWAREGLVFHQERQVDSVFRTNNLSVEERHLVEQRRDGTDYSVYLLSVIAGSQSDSAGNNGGKEIG